MAKVNTLEQQAYEKIKVNIVSKTYLPGSHLTEAKLVKSLEMSRTPIRRALVRLENEGLLKYTSHHGTTVQSIQIGMQELINSVEIRMAYLTFALSKAYRKNVVYDINPLKDCIETLELSIEKQNGRLYFQTLHSLDKLIIEVTNNSLMLETLSNLWDRAIMSSPETAFSARQDSVSCTLNQYGHLVNYIGQQNYAEAIKILEVIGKEVILDII